MAPSTTRKTTTTTRTIITTTTRTTMTTRSHDPSSSNSSSVPLEPQPARTKRPASALARERTRSGSDTSSTGSCDVIDLTVPPLHVSTERTEGSNEDVLPQEEARAERRIRKRSQTERDTRRRRSSNQTTGISPSAVVADIFQAIMETEIRTPRARSRSGTQREGERRGRGGGGGRPTTTTTTTMPSADIPPLDFNLTGDYGRWVPSAKVQICSPPKTVPEYMRRLEAKGFTRNGSAVIIVDEGASSVQTSVAATSDNPPNLSASSSSSSSTSSTSSTTVPPSRIPKTKTVAGRIKCPICSQLPSNGWHAIRCGHVFCENCILKVKNQRSCPACGKSVKLSDVRRLFL